MAFFDAHYTPAFSFSPPVSPSAPLPYLLIATRVPSPSVSGQSSAATDLPIP
jgi:hypothetical protein